MNRFPVTGGTSLSNDAMDYPEDHRLGSASYWTLHVRAKTRADLRRMAALLSYGDAFDLAGVTGWCGGDSFAEWCEVYDEDSDFYVGNGLALHVQYAAPTLPSAQHAAVRIAEHLGVTTARDAIASTAGDWAEQVEVFTARGRTIA